MNADDAVKAKRRPAFIRVFRCEDSFAVQLVDRGLTQIEIENSRDFASFSGPNPT
jgi:hypothetical protein